MPTLQQIPTHTADGGKKRLLTAKGEKGSHGAGVQPYVVGLVMVPGEAGLSARGFGSEENQSQIYKTPLS